MMNVLYFNNWFVFVASALLPFFLSSSIVWECVRGTSTLNFQKGSHLWKLDLAWLKILLVVLAFVAKHWNWFQPSVSRKPCFLATLRKFLGHHLQVLGLEVHTLSPQSPILPIHCTANHHCPYHTSSAAFDVQRCGGTYKDVLCHCQCHWYLSQYNLEVFHFLKILSMLEFGISHINFMYSDPLFMMSSLFLTTWAQNRYPTSSQSLRNVHQIKSIGSMVFPFCRIQSRLKCWTIYNLASQSKYLVCECIANLHYNTNQPALFFIWFRCKFSNVW
jgi:hypothetical protein